MFVVNSRMDPVLDVIVMVSLFAGGGGGGGGRIMQEKSCAPQQKKEREKNRRGNVFSSAHMHLFVGSLVRGCWCVCVCVCV